MATQVVTTSQPVQEKTTDVTNIVSGPIPNATSSALSTLDALSSNIGGWAEDVLDRFFPPEQREALVAKIKAFVLANPKVSAFLGVNIALTGVPLGLFIVFALSVAISSILGGIIIGLLGAVLFTLLCVGVTLTIVFPILMFTTAGACFLFLFGLGGYHILKWASGHEDDAQSTSVGGKRTMIGDGLNSLTGGRLTGLLNSADSERNKDDIKGFSDQHTKPQQPRKLGNSKHQAGSESTKPEIGKAVRDTPAQAPLAASVSKTVKAVPASPLLQRDVLTRSNQ